MYLGCVYGPERERAFREAWAKTGKKLDMGTACIRFKGLDDLTLDVVGKSIRRVSARGFIMEYESLIEFSRTTARRSGADSKRANISSVKRKTRRL